MRKNLFVTYLVTALLLVFTQCSENEVVAPKNQAVQPEAESSLRDNDAARKRTNKYLSTPVTGTINGIPFTAEYHITEFVHDGNTALYAIATLTNISGVGLPGEAANLVGQQVKIPVQTPAEASRASASGRVDCEILFLELGPLDLDLLGLQIHLDEVVLEIVAVPGAGNLLGNLLCAVASLLDGVAAFAAIAELLNNIIDLIGLIPTA